MKNVTKKKGIWFVTLPSGKVKEYKTETGALACAERVNVTIDIPSILTANCYFWSPSGNASGRRTNEKRHAETVDEFINRLRKLTKKSDWEIDFSYDESCKIVYKSVTYSVDGKTTNITGFIGWMPMTGYSIP